MVVGILLVALFIAFGTGFWLLFRLAWVIGLTVPAAWVISWYGTRSPFEG